MKSDGVSTAFSIIMEEISAVEVQLNVEGANAFKLSRYSDADRMSASGKALGKFRDKLEALRDEWNSGIDAATRERVRVEPSYVTVSYESSSKKILRVTLPSGQVIQRPHAAQTFTDTIQALGIDDVRALGYKPSGVDLVSTQKHKKYNQIKSESYYVFTHSNTRSKARLLQDIATRLHKNIEVEIV